jgi:hypothetical protein
MLHIPQQYVSYNYSVIKKIELVSEEYKVFKVKEKVIFNIIYRICINIVHLKDANFKKGIKTTELHCCTELVSSNLQIICHSSST